MEHRFLCLLAAALRAANSLHFPTAKITYRPEKVGSGSKICRFDR